MKQLKPLKKSARSDWPNPRIVYEIHMLGWTLRKLSLAHGYCAGNVRVALHQKYPAAEQIIADTIGVEPWDIWPTRYDENHQPLGRNNYPLTRRNIHGLKSSAATNSDNGNVERGE